MAPGRKSKNPVAVASSNRDGSLPDLKVKKRKRPTYTYGRYIYKVLKQIFPEFGISSISMSIIESFVNDIFHRIARESAHLVEINKKKVLSAREIETAVKLTIPGELGKHAVSEGLKSIQKYAANQKHWFNYEFSVYWRKLI